MITRHVGTRKTSRNAAHGSFGSLLLLAFLGACSSDAVPVGEVDPDDDGGVTIQPLPATSRCEENTTIEGDVSVASQAGLDRLEHCQVIEGDLTIYGFPGADLRPLHALTTVRGAITINGPSLELGAETETLASLEGLESLESAASLEVMGLLADNLAPLRNLELLSTGRLWLESPNLKTFDGLENLRPVTDIRLACPALEDIAPLKLAEAMNHLVILEAKLDRLSPLDVSIVSPGVVDISNTQLTNLDAFARLTAALGSMAIGDNPLLENIDGLTGLQAVVGDLWISRNPSLTHLPAFPSLSTLGGLEVSFNERLTEVPALSYASVAPAEGDELALLARSSARAIISDNPALGSVTIPQAWLGGAALVIDNNPALSQLKLTRQLSYDYVSITGNPALSSVDIGVLGTVDVLEVLDNPELDTSVFASVQTFETRMSSNAETP
jgi:hypothetical protein